MKVTWDGGDRFMRFPPAIQSPSKCPMPCLSSVT
jgi:hypothetical protein